MNIDGTVYIAEGVRLVGEQITIGKDSSVWFNSVIRQTGDEPVTIGSRTNFQDLSVIHTAEGYPVSVGDGVTIGHMCLIHGCTIGNNTLIGMGSTVMNGAVIGNNCLIGAGSLVTEGKTIPDGMLAFGRPAKVVRELTEEELASLEDSAEEYCRDARRLSGRE